MKSITSKDKHNTRDTILYTLKKTHEAKVEELAEAADISPVTVRHHLNGLQADGLVEVRSVRRKIGRPFYVYSLSEEGHELFPKKYFSLSNRLLEQLKNQLPAHVVNALFSGVVDNILQEHQGEFEDLPFEERLDFLIRLLAEEGFLARWEKNGDEYQLIEYSCPYLSVGHQHEEICSLDKKLMISVLGRPVNQHSCMLNGDDCCQFSIAGES